MVWGSLAMYGGRLFTASIVWEPEGRVRKGVRRAVILPPGSLGLQTKRTLRCPTCEAMVVPPDEADPTESPYVGRSLVRDGDEVPATEPPDVTWDDFEPRGDDDPLRH